MTNKSSPKKALISRNKNISAIWIVPIITLIFGAWLMIKTLSERGIFITVELDNAGGIVIGKTEVRYKGLPIGMVSGLKVSEDLQSVIVEIEMVASAKDMLTEKTLFWAVTADISFQGVSGLDTLLSGSYINIQPDFKGEGESQRHFIALSTPPILSELTPGLHINLQTEKLGSLNKNSPVSYKQITVGYVSGYQFDKRSNKVNIRVFIEPEYAHLVKENSRFWNAGGFEMSGSISSGLQIKTESLASIVSGGIAFGDAEFEPLLPPAKNGQLYPLHADFKTAEMGHKITLQLNWDSNIDRGSAIIYQGLTLGIIESFNKIDPLTRKITATAQVNPRIIPYLTTETQFFVLTPQVDLGGITNLSTLFKGPHVSLRPSIKGKPASYFTVYNHPPAYSYNEPGLHLILRSENNDSIRTGTGIFYNKQEVGTVQAITNRTNKEAFIHIHIKEKYQHYVTPESSFWNMSGIKIKGGLQNFDIQTSSLQSMLTGGIGFNTPFPQSKPSVKNGTDYQLFDNENIASQSVELQLTTTSLKNISTGMRILFNDEIVGSIHKISKESKNIQLTAGLIPSAHHLLRENSLFWVTHPTLSLNGINNTEALLGGAYISVEAGSGDIKNQFLLAQSPPKKHHSAEGLQLRLITDHSHAIVAGLPISYKGVVVGHVDNIALNPNTEKVNVNVTINEAHRKLITLQTKFFNASGLTIQGSIRNLLVKTESMDSILRGGISFYNPESQEKSADVQEDEQFKLYSNIEHARLAGETIQIHFSEINNLSDNLAIKYQGQVIGSVTRMVLDKQTFGATLSAQLNESGRKFAKSGTKFWLQEPQLGLVGSSHLDTLIEGPYINVLPGKGPEKFTFSAETHPPAISTLNHGLNITLISQSLGSIRVGNPVLYRQVPVGKVIGVDLANNADTVHIYINIPERYAALVKSTSRFWNVSGIKIDGGLFSGISVDTASLETLISGGIAFATPEKSSQEEALNTLPKTFKLFDQAEKRWLEWQPKILLNKPIESKNSVNSESTYSNTF